MAVFPKIAHEVLLIRAVFILEVYAYLDVAVTYKIRCGHAGLNTISIVSSFFTINAPASELSRLISFFTNP